MLLSVDLLADMNLSSASAFPPGTELPGAVRIGNHAYFTANDGTNASALWKTDGTAAGTTLVKSIGGPADTSSIAHLTVFGNQLLFVADDGVKGNEVWISDGTSIGTHLLRDINKKFLGTGASKTPGSSSAADFTVIDDRAFFTADDGMHGRELWVTTGTELGTRMVKDIDPSNVQPAGSQGPTNLIAMGKKVAFWASDGSHGRELWTSDGTMLRTKMVKDINPGKSNGTPTHASIALRGYDSAETSMAVIGNTLYFAADDGKNGVELWKSNGTAAGTKLVKDINPGGTKRNPDDSSPQWLLNLGGTLYFGADDGVKGRQLWRSDGTSAGTRRVAVVEPPGTPGAEGPQELTAYKGLLYFTAHTETGGEALWVSDGTKPNTHKMRDLAPPAETVTAQTLLPGSGQGQQLYVAGTSLYFTGVTDTNGRELWATDGTDEGTRLVRDIRPGKPGAQVGFLGKLKGKLLFAANDGKTGRELWISDGTQDGTQLVVDLNQKGSDSTPSAPVQADGKVFFVADDGEHGQELWIKDANGTRLVKDINPRASSNGFASETGPAGSGIHDLVAVGDRAFFAANDGEHGEELWLSDGSVSGTQLVKDINFAPPGTGLNGVDPASAGASIGGVVALGNRIVFVADDGTNGRELWISDGTSDGTQRILDINPAAQGASSDPSDLAVLENRVYFAANDGVHGRELWASDGTGAGTVLLKNINAETVLANDQSGPERDSNPGGLTRAGAQLFFSADNGKTGVELWRTDGTEEGTKQVRNINQTKPKAKQGPSGSFPTNFEAVGDRVFFLANDGVNGQALWKSDGTRDGTQLVRAFQTVRNPALGELTAVGDRLFFVAETKAKGIELWSSDGTMAGTGIVKDIYAGTYHVPPQKYLTPYSSIPTDLVAYDGRVYFAANDGVHGRELWTSDGTPAGTTMVRDAFPGAASGLSETSALAGLGDGLYFGATDGLHGVELWKFAVDPVVAAPAFAPPVV